VAVGIFLEGKKDCGVLYGEQDLIVVSKILFL
jgi:hypothetical protein